MLFQREYLYPSQTDSESINPRRHIEFKRHGQANLRKALIRLVEPWRSVLIVEKREASVATAGSMVIGREIASNAVEYVGTRYRKFYVFWCWHYTFQATRDLTLCLTAIMMFSATAVSWPGEIVKGANYEPMQVNKMATCRETVRWYTITDFDALSDTGAYNVTRIYCELWTECAGGAGGLKYSCVSYWICLEHHLFLMKIEPQFELSIIAFYHIRRYCLAHMQQ